MLIAVTAGITVFGLLWVPILSAGFIGTMVWLIVGFVLMGLTFGPMGALLPELFPAALRYTGVDIAYNIASMLGASTAPFIMVAPWRVPVWAGVYLSAVALVTLLALIAGRETRGNDILA